MKRLALALLVFLLALAPVSGCAASAMPPFRAGSVAHGKLTQVGGQWVLELEGTPEERGKAAGTLMGEQVRWLLPRFLKKVASIDHLSPFQKEMVAAMAAEVPAAHFKQLNALAEAAGVDRTTLFAVNLAPEALTALGCSCLATLPERAGDGKVRLARNLDWQGGELLTGSALIVIESGSGHRFASMTWPGLVSVVTGMNDAGLAVADLMALGTGGGKQPHPGVPVLFVLRSLLEQTDTVDSALAWLQKARRTIPQNYALADTSGAKVVETSTTTFRVRPSSDGLATITNYWREEQGGAKDRRYGQMLGAAGKEKLSLGQLQNILATTALGDMNVQAVVLEPQSRTAHVAYGKPPVAKGTWKTIDLSPWLGPPAVKEARAAGDGTTVK
jgi:hypothetical protein